MQKNLKQVLAGADPGCAAARDGSVLLQSLNIVAVTRGEGALVPDERRGEEGGAARQGDARRAQGLVGHLG